MTPTPTAPLAPSIPPLKRRRRRDKAGPPWPGRHRTVDRQGLIFPGDPDWRHWGTVHGLAVEFAAQEGTPPDSEPYWVLHPTGIWVALREANSCAW